MSHELGHKFMCLLCEEGQSGDQLDMSLVADLFCILYMPGKKVFLE